MSQDSTSRSIGVSAVELFKSNTERIPRGLAGYEVSEWDRSLGNHRALVRVTGPADIVCAYLPWRRRDEHPEAKHVLVKDARTGEVVRNVVVASCNKEYGEILFQPTGGPGAYHLYYLIPEEDRYGATWPRSSFPIIRYKRPQNRPEEAWMERHGLTCQALESTPNPKPASMNERQIYPALWRDLPLCEGVVFQSRGERHSFYPMELIATLDERNALEHSFRFEPFILCPELRTRPIRMTDAIPYCWAVRDIAAMTCLSDKVMRNEYYVFQVGVYASKKLLKHISATCSDLKCESGTVIPAGSLTCFNLEGTDHYGNRFTKVVDVGHRKIQPLWFGMDVSRDTRPGEYVGTVTVTADGEVAQTLRLTLTVEDEVLEDRGDGDHWRLSRLRWLNSPIALDDDVCAPFTPITVGENSVDILGRRIELDSTGMVKQVTSFIDMFQIRPEGREVMRETARIDVVVNGEVISPEGGELKCTHASPGVARYTSTSRAGQVAIRVETTVEMDGFIGHTVTLETGKPLPVDGVRIILPLARGADRYHMWGGGFSVDQVSYQAWFGEVPDRSFSTAIEEFELGWVGAYNAGICMRIPPGQKAWINGGLGRAFCYKTDQGRDLVLDSRPMLLEGSVRLTVELYATPFKPLTQGQWDQRHYHKSCGQAPEIREGQAAGASVFTYHHGSKAHPYISYPFLVADSLKKYADRIHAGGGRMKAYYTIRELSDRAPELWALRSLGQEILVGTDAKRGYPDYQLSYDELSQLPMEYQLRCDWAWPFTGYPWMCEHLVSDYQPRWHQPVDMGDREVIDASLQISGATRWANFYLEGLRWLMMNAGLDGIYLDGITFEREAFKRVRKTLVRTKPEGLIDYHSHPTAIAQMPYFDRLWNGEGADYNGDPWYWLVAISGVPFGVSGELLKEEASVQRGMVFGLSQRYGWMDGSKVNPSALWKWWDSFGIAGADMLGFWQESCPVNVCNDLVKATAYVHKGQRIAIAVASWAPERVAVRIELDWATVGLAPDRASITIPEISFFQTATGEVSLDSVSIEPGKGWIIVIESAGG